ncbi:MAG: methyltransferase [Pseudomonadota bacterium]
MTKDDVVGQYEAFPYPMRDPKDEAKRLITGSPSHPHEIDTHLYGGRRDWSKPFRALVAGGGTGDGLVQLAQLLSTGNVPYEIVYLDLSRASRKVAEARTAARGLGGVTFETGSLLEAHTHGLFDYVDCSGVLHHLQDPGAGLRALERVLKPGGGIGFMVYAPYGRSGVYPLQEALRALVPEGRPEERLEAAKRILSSVPEGHPFRRNAMLSDHIRGDAALYDLLLHSQDKAYEAGEWLSELDAAGLALSGWVAPGLYDLSLLGEVPGDLSPAEAMTLAEKLRGTITKHVGYAQRKDEVHAAIKEPAMALIPQLDGLKKELVQAATKKAAIRLTVQGVAFRTKLPEAAAGLLRRVDGRASLADIAKSAKMDAIAFQSIWSRVHAPLMATGALRYSSLRLR